MLCNEDQKDVQIQKPRKHPDVVITIGSIFRIIVKCSNIFLPFLVDILSLRAKWKGIRRLWPIYLWTSLIH